MALTSPPTSVAPFDKGRLHAGLDATATTCYIAPIFKTVNGVRVKQGINTTSGCAILSAGDFTELVTYTGASVDSTTKVTTVTGLTRGRDPTQTTASNSFAGGTGRIWAKGAKFTVVADATYFQSGVFTNVANTFTEDQTIESGNKLKIGGANAYVWTENTGTDLKFKDANNSEKTLSQLAAANGSDEKVKITSADTTSSYLTDAVTVTSPVTKTLNNAGANETLTIALDTVPVTVGGTGLTTATTAYAPLFAGTTATGAFQAGTAGTTGQILTSNGASALPTFQARKKTVECVYESGTDSTALTNPTTVTAFNTHTYTIPANDLISGVSYKFEISGTFVRVAGTPTIHVLLGSTDVTNGEATLQASNGRFFMHGTVHGTAAAGASVSVRCSFSQSGSATTNEGDMVTTAAIATDGTLALQFGFKFSSSDGSNSATLNTCTIIKQSSTAF